MLSYASLVCVAGRNAQFSRIDAKAYLEISSTDIKNRTHTCEYLYPGPECACNKNRDYINNAHVRSHLNSEVLRESFPFLSFFKQKTGNADSKFLTLFSLK